MCSTHEYIMFFCVKGNDFDLETEQVVKEESRDSDSDNQNDLDGKCL